MLVGGGAPNMTSFIEKVGPNTSPESSSGRRSLTTFPKHAPSRTGETSADAAATRADGETSNSREEARSFTATEQLPNRADLKKSSSQKSHGSESLRAIPNSIFDVKTEEYLKPVNLPQIASDFACSTEKGQVIKDGKDCRLPPINEGDRDSKEPRVAVNGRKVIRPSTTYNEQLFDYRLQECQKRARKRQIKLLQKRGFATSVERHVDSRFVEYPYEGARDDVRVEQRKPVSSPKGGKKKNQLAKSKIRGSFDANISPTLDTSADEETLAKIETAFREWSGRFRKDTEEPFRSRKRSASHSPPRTEAIAKGVRNSPSSCSGSYNFLHDGGNLRKKPVGIPGPGRGSGQTYQAIASPAESRKLFAKSDQGACPRVASRSHPIFPESRGSGKLSPLPQNKRLGELRRCESQISSSLPDLHQRSWQNFTMDRKSHRPRTSSLKKSRNSSPGKSPQVQRKSTTKGASEKTKKSKPGEKNHSKNRQKAGESPATVRRVVLNTSLPTASPTFQRAMKGMRLPDKDYSEIFDQSRRDSILQSYKLPENALTSFRDDYDLSLVESSGDALEEMTRRFKEDVKIYKDGWDSQVSSSGEKQSKSILKKRRQSVDDLEISTRKNLLKYLESKRDETDD